MQRPVIAVGLMAIGLIHVLDLPSKVRETPYLGVAYVIVITASFVAACAVLAARHPRGWLTTISAAAAAGPLVGYILSRTTGLPGATGDIGNWLEPLGLASLFVEGAVLVLVTQVWLGGRRAGAHPPPWRSDEMEERTFLRNAAVRNPVGMPSRTH
jgi:hypothetical protein